MTHKQVIVVRKDLKMGVGKTASQVAHASMAAILNIGAIQKSGMELFVIPLVPEVRDWIVGNFKKVCVYVNSEEELLTLYTKAKEAGIITSLITDSGLTQFHGIPTNTCIAIGPGFEENINSVTGHLPLL